MPLIWRRERARNSTACSTDLCNGGWDAHGTPSAHTASCPSTARKKVDRQQKSILQPVVSYQANVETLSESFAGETGREELTRKTWISMVEGSLLKRMK